MKYFVFLLILLILIDGCVTEKNKRLELFEDVVPEHYEQGVQDMKVMESCGITLSLKDCSMQKELLISSWVDSVSYVCLESSEDALLGSINKLIRKDEAVYLLDRYKTKSIKKFSMDGKFLARIGRYGEAPGEYVEPTDFVVNDSSIIVYDQFNSFLNYYTLDGQFVLAKKVPFLCLRFAQLSGNKFVFHSLNADNQHLKTIEDYSVFETDTTFVINKRGFYRKRGLYSSIISDFNFMEMNDKLYYHPSFSGEIYELNTDGACKHVVTLDFANKKLPKELLLNENWSKFKKESDNNRYDFFSGEFLFMNNTMYFSYANQHKVYRCFYSLKSKEFVGSSVIKNDIYPIFPFANLVGVDKNCIVGYVYPHYIVAARDNYSSEEWQKMVGERSVEISRNLTEEDNPILIWFHVRK